jgi:zeta-carotene desaturase
MVVEQAPRLGGRATAFSDRVTGRRVDNGQHALFGCYTETYALLRTIGTDALAPLDSRLTLTMVGRDAAAHVLRCPSLPAPFHLLAGALRWGALPWRERVALLGMRGFFDAVRRQGAEAAASDVPAELTVAEWLRAQGQGVEACRWLWEPITLAALNERMEVAAARVFARVIAELFGGGPEAAAIGVPQVPLDALYAQPSAEFVRAHGGEVRVRTRARLSEATDGRVAVEVGDARVEAAAVIAAVPWHAFAALWSGPVPRRLADAADCAASMMNEPIVTVHLWLDRPVLPARQVGLVRTTFQWAFQHDVVSMVVSGAGDVLRRSNADLIDLAVRELRECVPAARGVGLRHAVAVREPRATFSVAPSVPRRPGARTAIPGFYLAGDWTDTGLPATIEGAVRSGHRAAEAVLADRDDV